MKRNGQACLELVVSLVAVLVLFSGLLQIGILSAARSHAMMEARKEADWNAMHPVLGGPYREFIAAWNNGPDTVSYSADDQFTYGNLAAFSAGITEKAHPNELRLVVGENRVSELYDMPGLILAGLQCGEARTNVAVMPAIRNMLYAADSIDIECIVWMTEAGGVF